MERTYESYAARAEAIIKNFQDKVKEAQETGCEMMLDWRFTPEGKNENLKGVKADLQEKADNLTELFRENARKFCNEYKVTLPNDGKSHTEDVANALKVIDMVGFKLTPDILKSIMEPLKHSYTNMKMIHDVIYAKGNVPEAGLAGIGYDKAIYETLIEYMGINTSAVEYLDRLKEVEDIENIPGFKFSVEPFTNATPFIIVPNIPYEYYAVPETMKELGEMYATLENEFSELFTKHIPTDSELILSSLK
ncbi:MAG: hypothetical protein ACLVJ7_18360 [Acutalibacteraceae bacterium]